MLTLKRSLMVLLISSTPAISGPAESRIDDLRQRFNYAYNARDAASLAGLFAENAVLMPPGAPAVIGRDAIRARYAAQFGSVSSIFTLLPGTVQVLGNIAWLRGEYQRVDTPVAGGPATTLNGKYLITLSRERGDWRITTDAWNSNETPLQVDPRIALHAIRALAETRLRDVAATLKLLATTERLKSGAWETMKPVLVAFGNTGIPANAIWFVLPTGYYYTVEKGYTGLNLSERSYFPGLMRGQSVLGTLVVSLSTGKRSVVVAEPVLNNARQVIGGVGVSYSVDQLSLELDRDMQLPAETVFYALDMKGQTSLHRDPALMFEYPSDMASDTLQAAVKEMLAKESGTVSYVFRNMRKTIFFERSSVLDWVFAFGFSQPADTSGS